MISVIERPASPRWATRAAKLLSLACLLLAVLCAPPAAPIARGAVVGEFNVRVKDIRLSYSAYTVAFDSRIYDTTGAPPPPLRDAQIRFPRGAGLRSQFLMGRFVCNTALLEQTTDPAVCGSAEFGSGRIVLDPRPGLKDSIPTDIFLFLAKPRAPGAIASVAILVVSNQLTPVYDSQVLYGSLLPDSAPYGYRLVLPTAIKPRLPDLTLNLAELNLALPGLTMKLPTRSRSSGGNKLFWTTLPRCNRRTRRVSFEADYQFENGAPIVRQQAVRCSTLLRQR